VRRRRIERVDLVPTLASVPLLAGLDRKTLERLAEHAKRRSYAAGEAIVTQDAPASALYVIISGHVAVERGRASAEQVGELGAGDFFGELALIEEHPRTATVRATEPTECVLFVAWEFTALLKEHPQIAVPIMEALIARAHRREHHLQ
jgi:CRP/FNR family transcriptional regulator, cyclic AMP receptor protein